jgi:Kef-type K+ transport system membrane component KefB
MSHAAANRTGPLGRLLQTGALVVVFAALYATARVSPAFEGTFGSIAALGFLLLAGMLAGQLLEVVSLPHLTAYLLVGMVSGPHVLHLIDHDAVNSLQAVGTFALALIALAGGAELRVELLRPMLRSLSIATLVHGVIGSIGMTAVFLLLARFMPFAAKERLGVQIGIAVLWGVLAIARSPSAMLGVLAQTRADGPLTRYSLAFVMSSDVVVAVMVTLAIAIVRPLIEVGGTFSLEAMQELGHELLGSVSLGCSLGLLLAIYLRLGARQLLIVLLVLGFGLTEGLRYLRFDPLLTFLVAGFVVANFSAQAPKLMHAIEETGSVVFVVFFAVAGAHLDLPLLSRMWPIALGLAASRALITVFAHRVAVRWANDEPVVRRLGFASLFSQAGFALGLSAVIERAFPSFGPGFRALAIATIAINEMVGPVIWKLALDRSGEAGKMAAR